MRFGLGAGSESLRRNVSSLASRRCAARWFECSGFGHVGAYLAAFDLAGFDATAPPPQTAAFWAIVAAGDAPESGELRDVIDAMNKPAALSLQLLVNAATTERLFDLADELKWVRRRSSGARATPLLRTRVPCGTDRSIP
jgi:hypothetical protein